MVFSSLLFTFIFLPLVTGLFYLSKEKYRNYVLLVASFLFYAYGEPEFVYVMLLSILINYCFALLVNRANTAGQKNQAKLCLFLDVALNLALLFVCKYLNFAISIGNALFQKELPMADITLPIGISFFTFQALSYVIDVYYERVNVQKNPLYIALYISFFPQLIAGPIVLYREMMPQFEGAAGRRFQPENFAKGIVLFALGLSKKVLLADVLALPVNFGFDQTPFLDTPSTLLVILAYTFEIYFDFSGYSDMALGLGKMFNIELPANFNSPYKACSVKELWQRWHMTLSRFFIQYVYIPLGGSRRGRVRTLLNTFLVFFLSGLWHGASWAYIAWGGVNGLFIIVSLWLEPLYQRTRDALHIREGAWWFRAFQTLRTLLLVIIGRYFSRADSLRQALDLLGRLLQGNWGLPTPEFAAALPLEVLSNGLNYLQELWMPGGRVLIYWVPLLMIPLGLALLACPNPTAQAERFRPTAWKAALCVLCIVVSVLFFSGVDTFIYANF